MLNKMKSDKQEIIEKGLLSIDVLIKLELEKIELLKKHKKGIQQLLNENK